MCCFQNSKWDVKKDSSKFDRFVFSRIVDSSMKIIHTIPKTSLRSSSFFIVVEQALYIRSLHKNEMADYEESNAANACS